MFDTESIIGKTLEEAVAITREFGYRIRPVSIDGQALFGTCDYDTRRINVSIQNGIIQPGFKFG